MDAIPLCDITKAYTDIYVQRRRLRVTSGATAPGPALEGAPSFRLQTSTNRVHLKLSKLLFLICAFMLFEK